MSYKPQARQAARRYFKSKRDRHIFVRQMGAEGGFGDPTSPAGAQGPAQIMPATARGWGVKNVHDPVEAYGAAAHAMAKYLHAYGGSWAKALTAYNAGPARVGQSLPSETRAYIANILAPFGGRSAKAGRSVGNGTRGRGGTATLRGRLGRVQPGVAPTYIPAKTTTDDSGALVDALLQGNGKGGLLKRYMGLVNTGAYTTTTPAQVVGGRSAKYVNGKRISASVRTAGGRNPQQAAGPHDAGSKGHVMVDGHPVVPWLAEAVHYARHHGWKGSVSSGIRTKAEQIAAATRFGLSHYGPAGPLGSNHVAGHDGAIDVSDPDGFEAALRGYKGKKPIRAMADDPVHFSATGH